MGSAAITRANPLPLYAQIKARLQREIEGELRPGDALPSEPELEKRFAVSRITIRRALDELVTDGMIVRQRGRGTFVREKPIHHDLRRLMSWSAMMREMGYRLRTTQTQIERISPTHALASALGLSADEQVTRVQRLRYADDEPLCLMTNYLPERLVPQLVERGLVEDSVYATLAAKGLTPVRADDRIEARTATAAEATQLHVSHWSPLLQVTRVAFDAANVPLYVAVVAGRSERYAYTTSIGAVSIGALV